VKRVSILVAAILLLGVFVMTTLAGSSVGFLLLAIPAFLTWLFAWILPAVLKRLDSRVWIAFGVLILIGLIFPTSSLMSSDYESGPFSTLASTIIFLLPSLALVGAVFLLLSGLSGNSSAEANDKVKVFSYMLSTLLIIKTLYNLYDLTLWDNTYDPLGYLWLILPIFAIMLSSLTLFIALPYRTKPAGLFCALILPVLLISVSALAQSIDFRQVTAKRAERTVQAIESYFESNGSYPETLAQLTPRYILSLPEPMIIYGLNWCYESDGAYYRLGYIDREHWSDPNLIGYVYKESGEASDGNKMCESEISAIRDRNPDYSYSFRVEGE